MFSKFLLPVIFIKQICILHIVYVLRARSCVIDFQTESVLALNKKTESELLDSFTKNAIYEICCRPTTFFQILFPSYSLHFNWSFDRIQNDLLMCLIICHLSVNLTPYGNSKNYFTSTIWYIADKTRAYTHSTEYTL